MVENTASTTLSATALDSLRLRVGSNRRGEARALFACQILPTAVVGEAHLAAWLHQRVSTGPVLSLAVSTSSAS